MPMATNTQTDSIIQAGASASKQVDKRGLNVYSASELMGVTGKIQTGEWLHSKYQNQLFLLSVEDRERMVELCAPVLGVVSSRQNRISAMDWDIVPKSKQEDRIVETLKQYYSIYREYRQEPGLKELIVAQRMLLHLRKELPDLLPDGRNFQNALSRWRKNIKTGKQDIADEIEEWVRKPNGHDSYEDFIKKYVFDLLVHGAVAIYKSREGNLVDRINILPGGSVLPLREQYVSEVAAFAQVIPTMPPQIFFQDEITYSNYLPASSRSYGIVPLEALINKVAENLLFDQLMAEQADGTKPPNKAVIFGGGSPFGNEGAEFEKEIPLDAEEQARAEAKLNEARKNAIITLTGMGTPMVLDLSRENTMSVQMERQKMIREEVALVFNMSNLEINQSSSDGISGRATSESLETLEQNKGVLPIIRIIEEDFNQSILPFRYGPGYMLKYKAGIDEDADLDRNIKKVQSGLYSLNEVRTDDLGEDPFDGEEYDKPHGIGQGQVSPDGSQLNPFNMRQQ